MCESCFTLSLNHGVRPLIVVTVNQRLSSYTVEPNQEADLENPNPSLEPRDFDPPETVSGFVIAALSALPVGAAAIVSGAATAAAGKTFDVGAIPVNHKGVDAVNSVIKFADKHNEALVAGAATGAAMAAATAILDRSSGPIGAKVAKGLLAGLVGTLAGIAVSRKSAPPSSPDSRKLPG